MEKNRGKNSIKERLGATLGIPNVVVPHGEGERIKNDGTIEEQTLPGCKSFSKICLEFLDSVTVKVMEKERGRAEVCPLLLVCQDTGAIHTQVAYYYSTGALLVQ